MWGKIRTDGLLLPVAVAGEDREALDPMREETPIIRCAVVVLVVGAHHGGCSTTRMTVMARRRRENLGILTRIKQN